VFDCDWDECTRMACRKKYDSHRDNNHSNEPHFHFYTKYTTRKRKELMMMVMMIRTTEVVLTRLGLYYDPLHSVVADAVLKKDPQDTLRTSQSKKRSCHGNVFQSRL